MIDWGGLKLEILGITINIHLRDTRKYFVGKYFKGNVYNIYISNFCLYVLGKLNLIDNEICTLKINGVWLKFGFVCEVKIS